MLAAVACGAPRPQGNGLSLSPTVIDFGEVVVGLLERRTVNLVNGSADVVHVIEARPDDPIAGAVRLERVPAALSAGTSAEAEVVFAPPREGVLSGSLRFVTDGDPAELTAEVSGVASAPSLRVFPESLDFGRVMIGEDAVATATITNRGSKAVTIRAITPDMETSDEFAVGSYAIETLGPGASFCVEITFRPAFPGRAIGRVVVGDDSPRPVPLGLTLSGEGVDGDVSLEPQEIDFTGVLVGEERVRFFEVRNSGAATATIASISIEDNGDLTSYAFSIVSSPSAPFALRPGEERSIQVRFAPTAAGQHSGWALVEVRGVEAPLAVTLFAEVDAPPRAELAVHPGAIDFGGVELGSVGTRELVLDSDGAIEVHLLGSITIDPPGAPFTLVRAPAPDATLGPFDSHTLVVEYRPQAEGTDTAILRIDSDAIAARRLEVPLVGRGEAFASPDVDVRPIALAFGYVPRDITANRRLILVNGGTAPLTIASITVADPGGRFSLGAVPAGPLAGGAEAAVVVRYQDPTGLAVPHTATVAIATDDPDRPLLAVPLSAVTAAPRLVADADLLIQATGGQLHLLRSGGATFDRPDDCCWCNPNPRWGEAIAELPLFNDDLGGQESILLSRATVPAGTSLALYEVQVVGSGGIAELTLVIAGASPIVRTRQLGAGQRWRAGSLYLDTLTRDHGFFQSTLPLDTPAEHTCF